MSERHLYRGLNNFEGSIDSEGNLYDERHGKIGRIENGVIYDNCNCRSGTIENGKVWDVNRCFVGDVHGRNLMSSMGRTTGFSRGDCLNDGDGSEFGALMLLKKRRGDFPKVSGYEFTGDDDDEECEDEEDYEELEGGCDGCVREDDFEEKREVRKVSPPPPRQNFVASSRPKQTKSHAGGLPPVPPDSDFATGRKNEYRLNGVTYIDVSGKGVFWTAIKSFFAGVSGKGVITGWDRSTGAWDAMKRAAARR